jgi:hypothetical protein
VASVILALRAILPLVLILLAVLRFVLKERLAHRFVIGYGITLCVIGMAMFNLGIAFGLGALGEQVGLRAPAAFRQLDEVRGSPLYSSTLGQAIAVLFAFCLGFGATLAEPALNALGITVENLTGGALARRSLLFAVSGGVGVGIALGVAKIVWGLPLCWILIGGYLILFALTHLASERYVNVAWDSAGVTTGPVTVPLVVAVGLGMGKATAAVEGFGILAMASLCPIAAVLAVGLIADVRATRRRAALARAPRGDMEETAVSAGLGA